MYKLKTLNWFGMPSKKTTEWMQDVSTVILYAKYNVAWLS